MRLIFILILLLVNALLFTQSIITVKNAPKSSLKLYQNGVKLYKENQYEKAIVQFQKALQKSPRFIDAELQWGSVCFEIRDYDCAEVHFQSVLQLDSNYKTKVYYTLALTQYQLDHFRAAKENMEKYLSKESSNQELLLKANTLLPKIVFADSATRFPVNVTPVYLKELNTEFKEYLPTISADGKTCVFTRRSFRGDEDLYITYHNSSIWSEPQPIKELNTFADEASPALSQDGQTLVFVICNGAYSYGGCDLYYSEYGDEQWSEPRNMGEKINTAAFESQPCLAENGSAIYFTSNRKGSYGGFDIWMSRRKEDRSWSVPKNLGPIINTAGNEQCPYLHPNGSILYFSSDYFPGMGERDLFYSTLDTKGHWQAPVNLGYPINSKGDESSFIVFPNGEKAWMASNKMNATKKDVYQRSDLDLFELDLPAMLQVKPSTYVEITVVDKNSGKSINADVNIFDLNSNKSFYDHKMNGSGRLLIALPTGADYGLHIHHKDYLFVPDQFRCSDERNQYEPLIIHKRLEKISDIINTKVTLHNIFFEFGSAVLKPESRFELDGLVTFLNDNPKLKLKITGHTDDVGSDADNQILSQKRAQSVVDYLNQKGIIIARLISEGKGETMPVDSNETDEGRRNNRRIEFTIVR
jgi:outer membrane protein OmpA-like peptidoglycan-associated protein/tetratricopeptide (TPR) repeat protein